MATTAAIARGWRDRHPEYIKELRRKQKADRAEEVQRNGGYLRDCRRCKKEFVTQQSRGLYCSAECRKQAWVDARRRYWERLGLDTKRLYGRLQMRKRTRQAPDIIRAQARKTHVRSAMRRAGLDLADYERLLQEQKGMCAICGRIEPGGRNLAIDHDHATGAIRGLLCLACNLMLGYVRDQVAVLEKAIAYLMCHKQKGRS
jgi:hypothetical protein